MDAPAPAPTRDVVILRIAEGGMGYVELVARRDGRFSRLFARKRLHSHFRGQAVFRAMFLDEAHLAGLIRHPNVTPVLEVAEDDEGPFIMMEYVEGPSVAEILKRVEPLDRLLPLGLCVSIAAQAARGLHAAHELRADDGSSLGVVHRDISPLNLLVGYDGLVRVADFGIAKSKDNLEQTKLGVLKGNIGYMAPEHLRFLDLDRRSDLFALGVVLFEMLTRERLYGGDDAAAIARRILDEPPPDVFELRDVPPELAALLFDLLAKDRDLRPPTALAVANQLDAIAADLASMDGPFDVSAFLETELPDMRHERRLAVDAAFTLNQDSSGAVQVARTQESIAGVQVPAADARAASGRYDARPRAPSPSPESRDSRESRGWRSRAPVLAALALVAVAAAVAIPLAVRVKGRKGDRRGAVALAAGDAGLFAGGWHNCALRDERLWCWGNNTRGQLGDGTTENRSTPIPVHLGPVRTAALGEYHTCALSPDGRVSCFGRNVRGELGTVGPRLSRLPLEVQGLANVTALAAGRLHTCALRADGAVFCWGANESGQLGRPTSDDVQPPGRVADLPPARQIYAGGSNTCAALADGSIRCWGANESGQLGDENRNARTAPIPIPGAAGVVSLSIGNNAKGGSTKAAGAKPDPSASSETKLANVASFICAVTRRGEVLCWGNNYTGQLGDGTRKDRVNPAPVVGIADAVQVQAGDVHACALLRSGTVSCWGRNDFGAIGDDTMGPSTVRANAVKVVAMSDAIGLALGGAHSCARGRSGAVTCWGVNNFGQIGDGTSNLRPAPVVATGFP